MESQPLLCTASKLHCWGIMIRDHKTDTHTHINAQYVVRDLGGKDSRGRGEDYKSAQQRQWTVRVRASEHAAAK